MYCLTTFYLLLSAVAIFSLTDRLMDLLYVDRLTCDFNKTMCANTVCKSRFYNRTSKLLTIRCLALVPFESIKVKSSMFYHFTGGYRQFAININSDYCSYANGTEKSILLDLFFKYIKGRSNIDRKCPYTGVNYVTDLPLTAELFGGQFFPAGDYIYQGLVHINGGYGLTWKVYFNIPAGQTLLDDRMGK